jgi:hypothetical protein
MILSLIGSQSFAAVDAGGDYDILTNASDYDINNEPVFSYTSDYGDADAYHEFYVTGAESGTSELPVLLTEADAYAFDYDFNTPGAGDWIYVDSIPDQWGEDEYAVYVGVTVDPDTPVGPYSVRFYISTDPTVYADFTFVVTDSSLEPDAKDVTVYYYDQSFDEENLTTNLIAGGLLTSVPANGYYPDPNFDDRSYPTALDAVAASQGPYIEWYNTGLDPYTNWPPYLYNITIDGNPDIKYPNAISTGDWFYGVYKPDGNGGYDRDFLSKVEGTFDYYVEDDDLVIFVLNPGEYSDYDNLFPEAIPAPAI